MQSGTQLHLALLRKISHLTPTPNYRQKFNQFKRKRQSSKFQSGETLQTVERVNESVGESCLYREKNRTCVSKEKGKRRNEGKREENITISAWSTDGLEMPELERDTRYGTKESNVQERSEPEIMRKRQLSQGINVPIKRIIESDLDQFCNLNKLKRRSASREAKWGVKFSQLKQININYDKQNLTELRHYVPSCKSRSINEGILKPSNKLGSYDAFVSEIKTKERSFRIFAG